MVYLSEHFKLNEFTKSFHVSCTLPNIPPASAIINLTHLCIYVLEPLRSLCGNPIIINSGYRCKEINDIVKGVWNSQHLLGQAVDIRTNNPDRLIEIVRCNNLPFDQMISYPTFLHISYVSRGTNRKQIYNGKNSLTIE